MLDIQEAPTVVACSFGWYPQHRVEDSGSMITPNSPPRGEDTNRTHLPYRKNRLGVSVNHAESTLNPKSLQSGC
jgi:hypothetical protein